MIITPSLTAADGPFPLLDHHPLHHKFDHGEAPQMMSAHTLTLTLGVEFGLGEVSSPPATYITSNYLILTPIYQKTLNV